MERAGVLNVLYTGVFVLCPPSVVMQYAPETSALQTAMHCSQHLPHSETCSGSYSRGNRWRYSKGNFGSMQTMSIVNSSEYSSREKQHHTSVFNCVPTVLPALSMQWNCNWVAALFWLQNTWFQVFSEGAWEGSQWKDFLGGPFSTSQPTGVVGGRNPRNVELVPGC